MTQIHKIIDSPAPTAIYKGLEGIVADSTSISLVDGEAGKLSYRGHSVESLLDKPLAAALHVIVFGDLPDADRLTALEDYLWHAGRLPPDTAHSLRHLARQGGHPMSSLQAIAPLLALDPPAHRLGRTSAEEDGLVIAARLPAAIAAIQAALEDHPEPAYPTTRRYGERFLTLMTGASPSADHVAAFECLQLLQLDHGFNASTFTARVATSTLAPAPAAIGAALGTLFGPLHGSADQGALEMALEVGDAHQAARFVQQCLSSARRVLGMGHREYRVVDPRAKIMKAMARKIVTQPDQRRVYETLIAIESAFIEQTASKTRPLRANMEFYKGVVLLALGIRKEFFTATFAAARVFGWVAHIVEQRADNRIIRPQALYVGPRHNV